MSKVMVYVAGLMQTIPSIALLALMISLFGIGVMPAAALAILIALLFESVEHLIVKPHIETVQESLAKPCYMWKTLAGLAIFLGSCFRRNDEC